MSFIYIVYSVLINIKLQFIRSYIINYTLFKIGCNLYQYWGPFSYIKL